MDQLADEEALKRLHVPDIALDEEDDAHRVERAQALFGDLLPVRTIGMEYAGF